MRALGVVLFGEMKMEAHRQPAAANVVSSIIQMANPVFILIVTCAPIAALLYAINLGPLTFLNYVHVMTGGLWTGIDLFMGFVLGPILAGMEPKDRAALFKRLVPRMTFLMPVLSGVTSTAGFYLAQQLGFPLDSPRMIAAFVITGILAAQGFGLLLPNEIRIFQELLSEKPNIDKIARLGMTNAKLGGLQGVFQIAVVFVMATLRF